MPDFSHLSSGKYLVSDLRDFEDDMEDLDETICALCGLSPAECPCYLHPPHDCGEEQCTCDVQCSCCELGFCSCEVS